METNTTFNYYSYAQIFGKFWQCKYYETNSMAWWFSY